MAGAYDYSGTAIKAAVDAKTLLWFTGTKANMSTAAFTTAVGLSPWISTRGKGLVNYTTSTPTSPQGNLASSPIASSCFGCHDSTDAVAHMENNGGILVRLWSSVASAATRPTVAATSTITFSKTEQCMFCHSSTSSFGLGIKAVHAKQNSSTVANGARDTVPQSRRKLQQNATRRRQRFRGFFRKYQ